MSKKKTVKKASRTIKLLGIFSLKTYAVLDNIVPQNIKFNTKVLENLTGTYEENHTVDRLQINLSFGKRYKDY